ncbi:hypothetical protein TVAG_226470 [Trichomonas vaginalis G3]|uniref:Uncharacterized protein n=1 Tax=Trichomonas vaginalis (strain ATCC PRA-98 / G3) TaxID=412133 RepID=A2ER81_TRIV3|nr:hypothetical protein TVAGG3_0411210 [Trichomonas vaginalis G3]EAY04834.1 hypothetical protein TVAG_226470 [Trichomonas vaginalis G3]KAI5535356.1 hypothetical protein TVAGG3_0411210 [Trichomonas vaginalis G3]|eukprot:XP_001317057.1 hypothetical protein [Trichomonas vaginalis G3]
MKSNTPIPKSSLKKKLYNVAQFHKRCKDNDICVINSTAILDPRLEREERKISNENIKFFSGAQGIPYKFIAENEIWMIKGNNSGALFVKNFKDLDLFIQKSLKNEIEFKPFSYYKPADKLGEDL